MSAIVGGARRLCWLFAVDLVDPGRLSRSERGPVAELGQIRLGRVHPLLAGRERHNDTLTEVYYLLTLRPRTASTRKSKLCEN